MIVASLTGQRSARDGARSIKAVHRRNNDRLRELLRRSQSPSRTRALHEDADNIARVSRSLSPIRASNSNPPAKGSMRAHESPPQAIQRPSLQRLGTPDSSAVGARIEQDACELFSESNGCKTGKSPKPDSIHSDQESNNCSSTRSSSPPSPAEPAWPASFPATPHDCVLERLECHESRRGQECVQPVASLLDHTPSDSPPPTRSCFSSDRSLIGQELR